MIELFFRLLKKQIKIQAFKQENQFLVFTKVVLL